MPVVRDPSFDALRSDSYRRADRFWIWAGVGYQLAMVVLFSVASCVCLAVLQPETPTAQVRTPVRLYVVS